MHLPIKTFGHTFKKYLWWSAHYKIHAWGGELRSWNLLSQPLQHRQNMSYISEDSKDPHHLLTVFPTGRTLFIYWFFWLFILLTSLSRFWNSPPLHPHRVALLYFVTPAWGGMITFNKILTIYFFYFSEIGVIYSVKKLLIKIHNYWNLKKINISHLINYSRCQCLLSVSACEWLI